MHLVCTLGLRAAASRDLKCRSFCFSCPFDRLTIYDGPDNLAEKIGEVLKREGGTGKYLVIINTNLGSEGDGWAKRSITIICISAKRSSRVRYCI